MATLIREHMKELGRCKLCWRVILAVFAAIVVVEAAILVFSVRSFERDRLAEVEREALVVMRTVMRSAVEQNTLAGVASVGPSLSRGTVLRGAIVLNEEGQPVSQFGDAPVLFGAAMVKEPIRLRSDDGMTIDIHWPAATVKAPTDVLGRVDVSEVPTQTRAFIWRIVGLVLLISIFVTISTMIVLERLILKPMRGLSQGLSRVAANPDKPGAEVLADMGTDELLEVTTNFNRLSRRLAAAFSEIDRQHAKLEDRNSELETAVASRTRELRETVNKLRRRAAQDGQPCSPGNEVDLLTGLASRKVFWEQAAAQMAGLGRHTRRGAVLFIDLDDFKRTNEGLGFELGDKVLQTMAERIQSAIRGSDSAARLSGDEFAILQTDIERDDQPAVLAERLMERLSEPMTIDGETVALDCSIGISVYPNDGQSAETVINQANLAMQRAKRQTGPSYGFFVSEMEESAKRAREIELDLRAALENDELTIDYQPKLNMLTGHVQSMEALVRWHCRKRGPVSPAEFIPIAERSRLIVDLGAWVLRQACLQTRQWNETAPEPLKVAVNLSPVQIHHGRIVDTVRRILLETDLDPKFLELEVTESAIIEDLEETRRVLQDLRDLGVSIAVDDFGTGYTSLQHLKHLPINRIKIDRAFIKDIGEPGGDATIASAIIGIADSLGLAITAEGVETSYQLTFLGDQGIQEIQGYHISKPLNINDFSGFIQADQVLAKAS